MKKKRIAIVYGGFSNESKISEATAATILQNLDSKKHKIFSFDLARDLRSFLNLILDKKIDLVIPAIHGWGGEDGRLQAMLDLLGVNYIFSPYLAHAIGVNKKITKIMAKEVGLTVLPDMVIKKNKKISYNQVVKTLSFPMIVKPNNSGSSIGIRVAKNRKELKEAVKHGFKFDKELILEKFINGREFTVTVKDDKKIHILPIIEIIPKASAWFDYDAKYLDGGSQEICPAKISKQISQKLSKDSAKIYEILGCRDLARVDFIQDKKTKKIYFIEINTIPGLTKNSLVPKALLSKKIKISHFFESLIKKNSFNVRTNGKIKSINY